MSQTETEFLYTWLDSPISKWLTRLPHGAREIAIPLWVWTMRFLVFNGVVSVVSNTALFQLLLEKAHKNAPVILESLLNLLSYLIELVTNLWHKITHPIVSFLNSAFDIAGFDLTAPLTLVDNSILIIWIFSSFYRQFFLLKKYDNGRFEYRQCLDICNFIKLEKTSTRLLEHLITAGEHQQDDTKALRLDSKQPEQSPSVNKFVKAFHVYIEDRFMISKRVDERILLSFRGTSLSTNDVHDIRRIWYALASERTALWESRGNRLRLTGWWSGLSTSSVVIFLYTNWVMSGL